MKVIKITEIWCGSCLIMNKIWKKYEDKYETISLDVDMNEEEVEEYNIGDTLPVFVFIDKDKEIGRLVGEHSEEELIDYIEKLG